MADRNTEIREIVVCDTLYKVSLVRREECVYELYCTPCSLPSAVFDVATISCVRNECMEFDFYQAKIYTDPVEIIIDCDLRQLIERAITTYVCNMDIDTCNNNSTCGLFF